MVAPAALKSLLCGLVSGAQDLVDHTAVDSDVDIAQWLVECYSVLAWERQDDRRRQPGLDKLVEGRHNVSTVVDKA